MVNDYATRQRVQRYADIEQSTAWIPHPPLFPPRSRQQPFRQRLIISTINSKLDASENRIQYGCGWQRFDFLLT